MRPNVLLIVMDTARADGVEPYGAPAGSTPTIAGLARDGAAIRDTFAAACWTVPSHVAMFTGLLPRAAGLCRLPATRRKGARPILEGHTDRLFPEVMRRAGYATGAVSANLWISPDTGFDIGFEEFVSVDSGRQGRLHGEDLRTRLGWALEGMRARVDDGAVEVEGMLRTWLRRPRERPFFWFVNLVECHSPYLPPRPYDDLSALDRLRAAEEARRHLTLDAIWRACAGGFDVPDDAIARMRHLYQRAIRYMDDWLERVLEAFADAGVLEDTLVIVTSDHGENLGEQGFMGHSFSLDDRLLRVPLVVAGPGAEAAAGVRSLKDLPLFVAEATGVDEHPWADDASPAGVAVAQLDTPTSAADPRTPKAVQKWGLGEEAIARITTSLTAATDGRLKLLLRGDREELYDLEADPLEESPLDPGANGYDPARLESLRAAIADPLVRTSTTPLYPEPESGPSPEELREIEDRMRMLGYL